MKNNISILAFVFFFSLLMLSCTQNKESTENWRIVYRHDANGDRIQGNKQELMEAVRRGYPIRIGFGGRRKRDSLKSVEHVADAQFLTIANGKEVFAQITPIFAQKPNLDSDTLTIKLNHGNKWTMLIGTNGERSTLSKSFDFEYQEESKQSKRGATWYVKSPDDLAMKKAKPLWD